MAPSVRSHGGFHDEVRSSEHTRERSRPVSRLVHLGAGPKVEFEVPDRRTVALQDSEGFAIYLREVGEEVVPNGTALWFQVDDVDATFTDWSARGVAFAHGPQKNFWGYGAELADPDGYLVRLWDERTMREK